MTKPDAEDPFWEDMDGIEIHDEVPLQDDSDVTGADPGSNITQMHDSGCGSSLSCTPGAAAAAAAAQDTDLDTSKESGELSDDDENDKVQHVQKPVIQQVFVDNGYVAGSEYVPASLAEQMVLEDPPTPVLQSVKLVPTPVSSATVITDRVGANLTTKDKVLYMQNNAGFDFWQIAKKMANFKIAVQFKYIFVCVGLDWCLTTKKTMVKEGLRRMLYSVAKITENRSRVAICGITPLRKL